MFGKHVSDSVLECAGPYAHGGESIYHLHKQTQIFFVISCKSVLMNSFDIFRSHLILPLILLPFSCALCLPLAGIMADPLGVSTSGWLLAVPLKDQTNSSSNFTVGPPASCAVGPCQWRRETLPVESSSDIFLSADCWTFTLTKAAFVRSRHRGLRLTASPQKGL